MPNRTWLLLAIPLLLGACGSDGQPGATTITAQPANSPPAASGVRTQPVVPGRPGRVFVFAGVDAHCKPLAAPHLAVGRAPAQGDVTFKTGQSTTIAVSGGGTCANASTIGTGVYYTARAGSRGTDTFSVTATLASGETMERTFTVTIAE